MKKIPALILAAVMGISYAPALNVVHEADSVNVTSRVTTDSITTSAVEASGQFDDVVLAEGEPETPPVIGVNDGKWTVKYDDQTYVLSKLVEDSDFAVKLGNLEGLDAESMILKDNMGLATAMVAIIFGVPCLTIIVGLIVILMFALRRNRGRNELINNAIEHNYQLPDAFYIGQKSNGAASGNIPVRDSRKFYTATTLIAVGLSLIVFALYVEASFFIVAGGIPFLIGLGRLIGYYCVPATPRDTFQPPYSGMNYQPGYDPSRQPYEPNFQWMPQNPQPQGPQQPFVSQNPEPPQNAQAPQTPQTPPPYTPSR